MGYNTEMQIIISAENNTGPGFNALNDAISTFQQFLENATKTFSDLISTAVSGSSTMASAIDGIAQPIEAVSSELSTAFEGSAQAAEEQISQISQGFAGVTEAATASADAMAAAYESAASASEAAVSGIRPPSVGGEGGNPAPAPGEEPSPSPGGMRGMSGAMGLTMLGGMVEQGISPIKSSLEDAVTAFAQFDQSMRMVNEEAGLSQDGFKNLSNSVLDLSDQTGVSANDLSKGLYNILGTGLTDAAGGMKVLQDAADGAKAGNASLEDTTKALDSVMGAYGMQASQVKNVLDEMFRATNDGQIHFDDLSKSVGASATSAAIAGVSYSELVASQAALTNVGKNAQLASQQLNSLIMGMIAPTAGATKEAKSLGIEWDAAALKSKGLSGMIDEATKATGGNDDELKKLIPNQRAWQAAVALGTTAHTMYTKTLEDMKTATGSTAKALAEVNKGAGESIAQMQQEIVNAGIRIGDALTPALLEVAHAVEGLIKWFDDLSPSTKEFIGLFAGISVVVGSIAGPLLMLAGTLGMIATGFGTAAALIAGGFIVAIVAAIAVVALIIANWGPIKDFFSNLWTGIENDATAAWNGITAFFKKWGVDILAAMFPVFAIPIEIANHWGEITQIASKIWGDVTSSMSKTWGEIKTGASSAWDGIGSSLSGAWGDIKSKSSTAWTDIKTGVVDSFEWMYNHNYYFHDLADAISKEWDTTKQDATAKWNDITSWLGSKWEENKSNAQKTWGDVTTYFSTTWGGIKSDAQAGWNAFSTMVEGLWTGTVTEAESIFNPIGNYFNSLWNTVSTDANTGWTNFKTTIFNLAKGAYDDVTGELGNFGHFFSTLADDAYNWGSNLIHMLAQGIEDKISDVKTAASNVASSIASFLGFHSPTEEGPGSDADTWAPNLVKMFAMGLSGGTNAISSASNGLMQSLRSSMTAAPSIAMTGSGGYGSNGGGQTNSQNNALLQAITGLTTALSKTTPGGTSSTTQGYNQNAPLMHIQNMTVRNDSDLQQLQRSMYNSQQSSLRALGIRS